jgi:heme/copper-type cytochrome/quinol oxidase subunit 2
MNHFHRSRRLFAALLPAVVVVLLLAGVASACPTCKDSLANDPASASLVRGFYYSIVFMVSMPYVIFGSLAAYFYWQIRKARAKQAAEAEQPRIAVE